MKKIILLSILLLLFSCENKELKLQIDLLEVRISEQNTQITEKDDYIKQLTLYAKAQKDTIAYLRSNKRNYASNNYSSVNYTNADYIKAVKKALTHYCDGYKYSEFSVMKIRTNEYSVKYKRSMILSPEWGDHDISEWGSASVYVSEGTLSISAEDNFECLIGKSIVYDYKDIN